MLTISTIIAQAVGLPVTQIQVRERPALAIQSNRLYDVWVRNRHLIVKQFLRTATEPLAPVREFDALCRLAPFDIAPQPVYYDPQVAAVVVYEYLDGVMWDRTRPRPAQLAQLAQVWSTMATINPAGLVEANGFGSLAILLARIQKAFTNYAHWSQQFFPAGEAAAALCLDLLGPLAELVEALNTRLPVLGFCRLDGRFANVIQRPDGRVGMVDWEDSGLGDPAFALADMMIHVNQEDLLAWDEWMAAFAEYLQMMAARDNDFRGRVHLYHALIPAWWLAILLPIGQQKSEASLFSQWQINGLSANLRLRRLLARGRAWPDMNLERQLSQLSEIFFFPQKV